MSVVNKTITVDDLENYYTLENGVHLNFGIDNIAANF